MRSPGNPLRAAIGIVVALAASLAAFIAWADARQAHLRTIAPAAAHAARPNDPAALAKALDARITREPGAMSDLDPRELRAALTSAPLSRVLLRMAGAKAEADGNWKLADAAMSLSNAISRRDALTQLWLIERSVQKDDMASALRHYHAALSVHPELGQLLYPILSKAIAYPEVRIAIQPYLTRQTRWATGMLYTAIDKGNPADVAQLIIPVGDMVRGEMYESVNAHLMTRLAERGSISLATDVAKAVIPGMDAAALASASVSATTTDKRLGGLAWILSEDSQVTSSPNQLGGFEIDIAPLARGTVAYRFYPVLPATRYSLLQTIKPLSTGSAADLTWQASCLSTKPKTLIWRQKLPQSFKTQRYQSTIAVPPNCTGIELLLEALGPDGQTAAHLAIEDLELKPLL